MARNTRTALTVALLSGLALSATGAVQPPAPASPPAVQQAAALETVVSVNFAGGTLSQFVEAIRSAAAPEPVNIVFDDRAAAQKLPPIRLSNVALRSALEALRDENDASGVLRTEMISSGPNTRQASSPVYRVTLSLPRVSRVPPAGPTQLTVVSIKDLLQPPEGGPSIPVDTVLSAVTTAINMSGGSPESSEVKFHADSGLVILRANDVETAAVKQALVEMREDLTSRFKASRRGAADPARLLELKARTQKLGVQLQSLAKQGEIRKLELDRLTRLAESGQVSGHELEQARIEMLRLDTERQTLMIELDQLQATFDAEAAKPGTIQGPFKANLAPWGPQAFKGATDLLRGWSSAARAQVGESNAPKVVVDANNQTVTVEGEQWALDYAALVLREYARANGLAADALRPRGR